MRDLAKGARGVPVLILSPGGMQLRLRLGLKRPGQMERFLDFGDGPTDAVLADNLDWTRETDTPAKARMFSVVPSLDTPVCSQQTKKFEDGLKSLGDGVAAYTVSLDLPFAQKRFCGAEGVSTMTTLSDVHNHSFGENWGVLIEGLPLPLLARSVFVVDKTGTVT